jgi:putative endonuclease
VTTPEVWIWYVLRCADSSLYCGITTDMQRRLDEHNRGTGSRYVRSRRPATVAFSEVVGDRSTALKKEAAFKKLGKARKEALVASD